MGIPRVEWAITSRPPVITGEEVHIWRIDLPELANVKPELLNLLSADERQRADKFHFEKDRSRFIIRRAMLRRILGEYLNVPPAGLSFKYNNFDKPALIPDTQICFNASSSNTLGIVAVTFSAKIGIDVEFIDAQFPKLEIAERYFSKDEVRAIHDLQPELQTAAFFDCWTKKEAFVKAVGDGMSHPLPNLVISSEKPDSFSINAASRETNGWCISSFVPEQNFVASIAYEGAQKSYRYFRWPAL